MYTHARQFPHFTGMSDLAIRDVARRAMTQHPGLVRVMKIRNAGVLLGMIAAAAVLTQFAAVKLGMTLLIVGAVSTAFLLLWNLIWLNTVMLRITREEIERSGDSAA